MNSDFRLKRGFTLIEVCIVMAIILSLACIATPKVLRARDEAKKKQAQADLEILSSGVLQLAWDTGKWPGMVGPSFAGMSRTNAGQTINVETWDLTEAIAGVMWSGTNYPGWRGPYVPRVPKDPWGNPYFFDPDYRIGFEHKKVVGSFGPNGQGQNVYDSDNLYIIVDEK